jgi:putative transposase
MSLLPNSLIETTDENGDQRVKRVLDIDVGADSVFLIRIDRAKVLPEEFKLSQIEAEIAAGRVQLLTVDPFAHLLIPEDKIDEAHRERRDAAWAKIREIIEAPDRQAFYPESRGKLVRAAAKRSGCSRKDIYRYLSRYWQAGKIPNGLLPRFDPCGRCRKRREFSKKLGRRRNLTKLKEAPPGVNVTPEAAKKLQKGYRMFHLKTLEEGQLSKKMAYHETLKRFFKIGYEKDKRTGLLVSVLPPDEELPSLDQFLYWATKDSDFKKDLIRRQGDRRFNLRSRAVLGDSTMMAYGPGSLYQTDATRGDDWLVSALNPTRRLGCPTVILVVDTFSHMITGYYVGLDNDSFFAAGLALENAFTEKVEHCRKLGISIEPEDWPCDGLFEGILADRGPLRGHSASNLVQSLGIRIATTSPFRADCKGIGERTFRSMNDLLIHGLPGAVRKPKERGERDPRLEAGLTVQEFETLLVHAILYQNQRRIEGYRLQRDMIADGIEPRPVQLWAWGIRNRSGHLRAADPAVVRSNLLPWDRATVTHRGIKYRNVFYGCERAMREGWYERARASRSWQVEVAYDPRLVDSIYLRIPDVQPLECCDLLPADQRLKGVCWADVEEFHLSEKKARDDARTVDRRALTNFQAPVDAIVSGAVERAAAANKGLTNAAQRGNVRENRKAEQRLLTAAATSARADAAQVSKSGAADDASSPGELPASYVPPSSPLEMLRKQREANWSTHD